MVKEALAGIYQMEILLPRNPLRAINAYLVRGRSRCLLIDTGMNAHCERLLGSLRRECLDFLIPLTENHLMRLLNVWRAHYNRGRLHTSLGPGIPHSLAGLPATPLTGHRLPSDSRVVARSILGGLHHEYGLGKVAA